MAASNSIKELNDLAMQESRRRYPNLPDYARSPAKYKENTSNDLTKAIIHYITFKGGYAVRINTQGQWNESLNQWTKSMTRKGTADIHACYQGRHYSIEIKVGNDRMSTDQIVTEHDVQKAGGIYICARSLESVMNIIK